MGYVVWNTHWLSIKKGALWSGIIRGFVSNINEVAGIANICQGDSNPQQLLEPPYPSHAGRPCWEVLLLPKASLEVEKWGRRGGWKAKGTVEKVWRAENLTRFVCASPAMAAQQQVTGISAHALFQEGINPSNSLTEAILCVCKTSYQNWGGKQRSACQSAAGCSWWRAGSSASPPQKWKQILEEDNCVLSGKDTAGDFLN